MNFGALVFWWQKNSNNKKRSTPMKRLLLMIFLTGITALLYSQNSFNESIKDYDDICFCNVGLAHPKEILDLDNNLEILFALKNGRTLNELNHLGVKYNQSQITLLETSGLIKAKDSIYYATVPILPKEETFKLRKLTKEIAKDMIPRFQKDYEILFQTLKSKGLQQNGYSLFFAFVLDGIVWDMLEKNGITKETTITNEKPFWNGVMWMIEPKRKFSCGTNCLSSGNLTISVNWSDESGVSVSSYKMLRKMLNDYKENGKITTSEVSKTFGSNGLFDNNGILQIPIIKADSTDIIYNQSENIAKIIVGYLKNDIDYSKILAGYPDLEKGDAITIVYHEIMWDILDIMEENGQIEKPRAFRTPTEAKPEDLKDLIFIVRD